MPMERNVLERVEEGSEESETESESESEEEFTKPPLPRRDSAKRREVSIKRFFCFFFC